MSDEIEAQEIYCTECDEDYTIAWSEDSEQLYVVCDCGAEAHTEFVDRFKDEYEGGPERHNRMYQ